MGIARYDPNDFFRNIRRMVVGNHAQGALRPSLLDIQDLKRLLDHRPVEARHHHGALFHAFRPFVRLADIKGREIEDGGFLGDGPAVGKNGVRIHLELDIVAEPKRLVQFDLLGQNDSFAPRSVCGCGDGW